MQPKENLRAEHGDIMKIFVALQKISAASAHRKEGLIDDLERIIVFLEIYIDRCHHGKEEEILFPALEALNDRDLSNLISELRSDHRIGRAFVEDMRSEFDKLRKRAQYSPAAFVDTSKCYIDLFRKHIRIENAKLLPVMEKMLSKEKLLWIEKQFEKYELENVGMQMYKAFNETLEKLTQNKSK
jgi:hemerythrin-like domain-containing protein